MTDRRHKLAAVGAVSAWMVLAGVLAAPAHDRDDDEDRTFTVALWGDTPYTAGEPAKITALIADINAARVAFSIFDGDIKSGSSRCDDVVYTNAIDLFNTFRAPMIYVPGDNEWTDCHVAIKNNGLYTPTERLQAIRALFFPVT